MIFSGKRKSFQISLISWTLAFQMLSVLALQPEDLELGLSHLDLQLPSEPELDSSAMKEVQAPVSVESSSSDLNSAAATNKVVKIPEDKLQTLEQEAEFEEANYDFRYQIHGGGNYYGHHESRRDEKTVGQYHVLLPDGRKQTVTYFADETGYHPTVTYEYVQPPPPEVPSSPLKSVQGDNSASSGETGYRPKRRAYRHSRRVLRSSQNFQNS